MIYSTHMNSCIFCKIASGEIPAEKIFETEHAVAFLDIMPRAPGHTMVIPKIHAENLSDLPREEIGPYFEACQRATDLIKKALTPDGFTLGMNYGRVSGQEVDHLHFHILPRWQGDGGHSLQSVVSNKPTEDVKIIAEKIRKAT